MSDYFGSTADSPARRTESSLGLKSHQDKARSPLIHSHQTSVSSGRESAPVTKRQQLDGKGDQAGRYMQSPASGLSHSRSVSGHSRTSARSQFNVPRRRPSVNDLPTLYPDAPRTFHAVSPPPALINSSLPRSMRQRETDPKPPERARWWPRSKTDISPDAPLPGLSHTVELRDTSQHSSTKVNVKRPKAGVNNWFDSFDEDDMYIEATENPREPENESKYQIAPKREASRNPSHPYSANIQHQTNRSRKTSLSSKSGRSDRKLSFRLDSYPEEIRRGSSLNFTTRSSEVRLRNSGTRRLSSTGSKAGILGSLDLQFNSVLNLSSSDDEDESALTHSGGPRIRDSVETSDVGSEILVGSAQRAQPVRPCPIVNKAARRRSPRRSRTPDNVPPVPQLPSRQPQSPRNCNLRDVLEERGSSTTDAGGDSTVDSGSNGETPLTTPISTRTSSLSYKKKAPFRGSKLMKVTSEEEKLLEAMRQKRASIHLNEFQKGFNKALSLQDPPATTSNNLRPTTSGAVDGGRDPFRRSSSLFENVTHSNRSSTKSSRSSVSPAPLMTAGRYSGAQQKSSLSLLSNQKSMSTESLLLAEEQVVVANLHQTNFPFPPQAPPPKTKLPDIPVQQVIIHKLVDASPSKQSPTLSFGASDYMSPSTPSTGNMPLTPPPMAVAMLPPELAQGQALGRTLSESSRKSGPRPGHDRKKTASSVVVLDGVELAAREADEARDIIGWALDSY